MLSELYWGKYPITYPKFNVVVVGNDEKVLNFLKRIMPDKTSINKVDDNNKWYDNIKLFNNYLQVSFPNYIDKNSDKYDKNSMFSPILVNKEDKFRITYGEKVNNSLLSYADMIFFLESKDLVEYLKTTQLSTINNCETIKDVYFVIDKRQRNMKVCYVHKMEFDRYI